MSRNFGYTGDTQTGYDLVEVLPEITVKVKTGGESLYRPLGRVIQDLLIRVEKLEVKKSRKSKRMISSIADKMLKEGRV